MPRRRMIDPDFWRDSRTKRLPPVERLFFLGMVGHADDEGRLLADPAYLRSIIFPYDDFSLETIQSMRDHILETNPNAQLYVVDGEEYLYFRKWSRYQKPSHAQPSKLPKPPELQESVQEQITESIQEPDQPQAGLVPSQVSQGQSSQGKDRSGKVQEDFTGFINSDKDLTDFLMTTLIRHMSSRRERARQGAGATPEKERAVAAQWAMPVLEKFWEQVAGAKLSGVLWQGAYSALQNYPVEVIARAFVKAAPYKGGKHKSWKYIQTIIDEELEKRGG